MCSGKMELSRFNLSRILAHDPTNATALEGRSIINLLSGNQTGALAGENRQTTPHMAAGHY